MSILDDRKTFIKKLKTRNDKFRKATSGLSVEDFSKSRRFGIDLCESRRSEGPKVVFDPPVIYTDQHGTRERDRSGLFTMPFKMAALSFSPLAGPRRIEVKGYGEFKGTCPASSIPTSDPLYICNGCYAMDGNYNYPSKIFQQVVATAWARQAVKDGTFAEDMVRAIKKTHTMTRASLTVRSKKHGESHFDNHGYFRIHDSGDFYSMAYMRGNEPGKASGGWFAVAKALPDVKFWAPTRNMILPVSIGGDPSTFKVRQSWVDEVIANAPKNLIIRQSSMYFNDPPLNVRGLAGGASSASGDATKSWGLKEGKDYHQCPVERKDYATCEQAGCRKCWDKPEMPINYHIHASEAEHLDRVYGASRGFGTGIEQNPIRTRRNAAVFSASDPRFSRDAEEPYWEILE